jgi:hypothetical protein
MALDWNLLFFLSYICRLDVWQTRLSSSMQLVIICLLANFSDAAVKMQQGISVVSAAISPLKPYPYYTQHIVDTAMDINLEM